MKFISRMKPRLVKNGIVVDDYCKDATTFINEFPRGAYTAARTVDFKNLFQFPEHVTRLNNSCKIMIQEQYGRIHDTLKSIVDYDALSKCLLKELHSTFHPDVEQKITILITWEEDHPDIY